MKELLDAILDPGSQPADFAALPLPEAYQTSRKTSRDGSADQPAQHTRTDGRQSSRGRSERRQCAQGCIDYRSRSVSR